MAVNISQFKQKAKPFIDFEEVRKAFPLFAKNGQVIELRALGAMLHSDRHPYDKPRVIAGWFDNVDSLVTSLQQIASAEGIYVTINPCEPALLARANNRLKDKKVTATTDDQIIKRQLLILDTDPERAGHVTGVPTDDAEHQAALDFIETVCDELKSLGWPNPLKFDSGNGAYLIYAIDLPANDNGLIERVLKGVAQRFDTEQVHTDLTTFNQSRIARLPGTMNCKGDGTPDRPHRMAKIISIPDDIWPVPVELLEAMAALVKSEEAAQPQQEQKKANKSTFYKKKSKSYISARDFIEKYELATVREEPYKKGTKYLLAECPFCHETDHCACVYDTTVGDVGIGFSCSHNRCKDLAGIDFILHFDPDFFDQQQEETALSRLMRIADEAHLICTPSSALYARVPINSHHEIVSIGEKGSGFRRWLVHRFKAMYGFAPNSDAISQTMAGVQADAEFIGERAEIYTRIAEKNGCIYLDLANDKWQCVEISADGWRVITCPPVYFRRPSGMLPLPLPTRGGNLDELKELINAKEDRDYKLITAWLVGTLHPKGPYPILNLNGERGSTKSKGTSILRNIIDPNLAPSRTAPKDDREAAITAQNNMVVALDNLSSMPLWLSDLLCRIATGSGYSARELYTDDGERVFNSRRPIIMNGIEDGIITQGDLLNRTIMVTLTPPDVYRSEEELDDLFREKHPSILGALLTVASVALRDRRRVQLDNPPRMADFAKWIVASESALGWKQGTFIDIYTENQASATSIVMDSSPVAKALVEFMDRIKEKEGKNEWTGLISELHAELTKHDTYKDAKKAPKAANTLSGHLRRIKSSMLVQGIDIQEGRKTEKGKPITLKRIHPDDTSDDKRYPDDKDRQPDDKNAQYRQDKDPLVATDEYDYRANPDDPDDLLPSLSAFYPPEDFEKEEKKRGKESKNERADGIEKTSSGSSGLSAEGQKQSDAADLLPEYQALYQQVGQARIKIAPLGNIHWYVPDSGYPIGQVATKEYERRLKELYTSGNRQKILAGLEEMKRKLMEVN